MTNAPDAVETSPQAGGKPPPWWRPRIAPESRSLLPYYWAYIVGSTVGMAMVPMLVVLLIARFAFHLAIPVSVFLLAIAASGLGLTACQAVSVRLLFHAGRWRRLDGRIGTRAEHPRGFWAQAAAGGVIVLVGLGVGGFLIWTALFQPS